MVRGEKAKRRKGEKDRSTQQGLIRKSHAVFHPPHPNPLPPQREARG
jgi:hypothetical protein